QRWMAQMGARTPSPLTTLEEVVTAVKRLLAGERVTMRGRHVRLEDVQLDQPPALVPPVLAGVRGPRSLALAGRVADGVVLAEPAGPSYVRWALERAGRPEGFHVATFSAFYVARDRADAHRRMAPWLARQLSSPSPGLRALPRGAPPARGGGARCGGGRRRRRGPAGARGRARARRRPGAGPPPPPAGRRPRRRGPAGAAPPRARRRPRPGRGARAREACGP